MTSTMVFSFIAVAVLVAFLGVLRLRHLSLQDLVFGLFGAITGLLLGALASVPLSKLPGAMGGIMPVAVSVGLTVVLIAVALARRSALLTIMPFLDPSGAPRSTPASPEVPEAPGVPAGTALPQILVDTSVIIDGRIADIAAAGFVPGRLTVPRFVLAELQNIADSDDAMRRGRGRRGLDVLNTLRELPDIDVAIIEDDAVGIREVDAKLVALAQRFGCNVLTTDYNLNRVAQIQGVRVLNVNELSNAIRPVVLPGEELIVRVVQPGKERSQGVGYLADGTMIVVENGDKLIGQEVVTEVTRVFQTVAGKMIFAVPRSTTTGVGTPADRPARPSRPTAPVDAAASAPVSAPAAAAPETAAPADALDQSQPQSQQSRRNRNRGGRNNGPKRNQNPAQGPAQNAGLSIEDRVIAAANQSQPQAVATRDTKPSSQQRPKPQA